LSKSDHLVLKGFIRSVSIFGESTITLMKLFRVLFFKCIFAVGDTAVKLLLFRKDCVKVWSGPFAGMCWGTRAVGSELPPKLLGTYEMELAAIIERLPVFDLVIDIGAAEGWYAVGLLHRKIAQKVVAFELTEQGRTACQDNARRNAVAEQLEIRGKCDVAELQHLLGSPPRADFRVLIVSDCEGFESELFSGRVLELCRKAHLIIETHELLVPGTHKRLARELAVSHEITHLRPMRRSAADAVFPGRPTPWWLRISVIRRFSLLERRGTGNLWLYAAPKIERE
jgi:hypothetical protein